MCLHDAPERLAGQLAQRLAGPVAVTDLDQALVDRDLAQPTALPAMAAAVSAHRSSGLEMIASSLHLAEPLGDRRGLGPRPRSSSGMPGVRPDSAVPVAAVRPCRTTRTKVTHRLYGERLRSARRPVRGVLSPRCGCRRPVGDDEADRAETHLVTGLDRDPGRHPPAVQPGAVRRAEVGQQPLVLLGYSRACQRDTLRSASVKSQAIARPMVNRRPCCGGSGSGGSGPLAPGQLSLGCAHSLRASDPVARSRAIRTGQPFPQPFAACGAAGAADGPPSTRSCGRSVKSSAEL